MIMKVICALIGPGRDRLLLSALCAMVMLLGETTRAQVSSLNGNSAEIIPELRFSNVPMTTAIQCLARQSGLNYFIDPKLFASPVGPNGNELPEPALTITWTNISARDALARILKDHELVALEDPFTTVTLITGTNHVPNLVDASLLASTDPTNTPVPLMCFADVPLDAALKHLIEQGHLKAVLDSKVSASAAPAAQILHPVPTVSIRWVNLTAEQAVIALCKCYGLHLVRDPAVGGVTIKPAT